MSDLKNWYLGGMVEAADKAEFKEDEHPRGKGGMFVKKGEGGGSDGVAGKVAAYRKKHEAFSKELLKDLNSPVAEKMRGELQSMLSELDGMGVDVERLGVGKDDKIPMKAGKSELKKGEQKDDGKLTGADFTFNEKNGVVTVLAPESVNVGQDVRKKMIDEIKRKYPNKEFSFSKFSNGVSDGIKAVEVKGEGGSLSALEEVYKKGGFKHPEALAKADLEELGKMDDSRLDAEITMLKGKVEEGGKPLDKARLEAAEGIMKGRNGKKGEGGDDNPYAKSLEIAKAEKEKRGGKGGKISVAENGKTFTVEGKLTNEQIKFLLFGNEDGHRHAGLTIDGIDCSITQEDDGKLILWGRAATSGMGQKGRIIKDGMKNIGKVSGRLGTLFFNPEKPNENPYKKQEESLKESKKPSVKKIENDDDDWLD